MSPSLMTTSVPETTACFFSASILRASTPHTHGAPMPRAITAAWEVLPPWLVRMPSAAIMPARSSGLVSQRTSTHLRPASAAATASAAENTASPTAAPGEAFRPRASTSYSAFLSNCGCSSWSSCSGSTRMTASSLEMRPSFSISMAMCSAAAAVRLPTRVYSMYSLPCSMVNSMSHMSRKWFSRTTKISSSCLPASSRPATFFSSAMGLVLRMPATTSSPWALTR